MCAKYVSASRNEQKAIRITRLSLVSRSAHRQWQKPFELLLSVGTPKMVRSWQWLLIALANGGGPLAHDVDKERINEETVDGRSDERNNNNKKKKKQPTRTKDENASLEFSLKPKLRFANDRNDIQSADQPTSQPAIEPTPVGHKLFLFKRSNSYRYADNYSHLFDDISLLVFRPEMTLRTSILIANIGIACYGKCT